MRKVRYEVPTGCRRVGKVGGCSKRKQLLLPEVETEKQLENLAKGQDSRTHRSFHQELETPERLMVPVE